MYHAHFGLRQEPFGVSPDQHFFFETEQHREALATLYYAIQQRRGFALILGRAGLGKTSVLVQLMQFLEGKAEIAYLPQSYFNSGSVLESILTALGVEIASSTALNHRRFHDHLKKVFQAGKTCVVIFDEAQGLGRETLEEIRMLSNFESPTEKLIQIVLAGQPGLADTLKQDNCEQIRQRLNAVARLAPLTHEEMHDYLAHRLTTAGASLHLFSGDALNDIVSAADGVPRNANTICFNSLSLAYALNRRQVGREEVAEVLRDLNLTVDVAASVSIRTPEPTPVFSQPPQSFRSVWITASIVLLAAAVLLLQNLVARPVQAQPAYQSASSNVVDHAGTPHAGFAVQVGAFHIRANAEHFRREMESRYGTARLVQYPQATGLWRVLVGSEPTENDAKALAARIRRESSTDVAYVTEIL